MVKKLAFIIIIGIGILLRIYNISGVPPGLFADEIALGINSKTIAEAGVDEFGISFPFGFESFSDYKLPGYIYATAISYKLLGPTILAIRLPALLASIASIFLIGYLSHLLFPKKIFIAVSAMSVLALSPFHIHFGRISYETMLATTFFLVFLIGWINCIKQKSKLWYVVGALALLLSTWTYHSPRFIIPVLTLGIFLYGLAQKKMDVSRRQVLKVSLFFFCVSLLSYIPFLNNPEVDKRPLGYVFGGGEIDLLQALFEKMKILASSWIRMWNLEFLFLRGDLFGFRHGTGEQGVFLGIFIVPLVAGIAFLIKNLTRHTFSLVFLLVLLVVCGMPSALTNIFPYGPRLLPVLIPFSILIGIGLDSLLTLVEKISRLRQGIVAFAMFSILIFQIVQFSHIYFVHFPERSLPEFPDAPILMSQYVKNKLKDKPKPIYFLGGRACLPWGYDELKLWYFAGLNNKAMIAWNNQFREMRFASGNPFGSFDQLTRPKMSFASIHLHPEETEIDQAPKGSIIIRCGIHTAGINKKKETITNLFYMYNRQKRDVVYVVSEKK